MKHIPLVIAFFLYLFLGILVITTSFWHGEGILLFAKITYFTVALLFVTLLILLEIQR